MNPMTQAQGMPQNPLGQLKDIHLPDPVSIWPLGIGWWVLFVAIVLIALLSVYLFRKNQWKRYAKKQLLAFDPVSTQEYYYQINRTLKQIAVQRFGQQCAHLSGDSWLAFLDSKLKTPLFQNTIPEFASAPDNPSSLPDPMNVQRIALQWLQKHKMKSKQQPPATTEFDQEQGAVS